MITLRRNAGRRHVPDRKGDIWLSFSPEDRRGPLAVQLGLLTAFDEMLLPPGEEALPALNYAWLLMLLPQGIFALAIATAVFPTFSELATREEKAELRRTLSGALGWSGT